MVDASGEIPSHHPNAQQMEIGDRINLINRADRPFTVHAWEEPPTTALKAMQGTTTHCKTLEAAMRSGKTFAHSFTAMVICEEGVVVKILR